jgi:hypothetical protein
MAFLPGKSAENGEQEEAFSLLQPEEDDIGDDAVAARHIGLHLQTRLTSEGLQRRLLKLYDDARTFEEAQGVNILYLAQSQQARGLGRAGPHYAAGEAEGRRCGPAGCGTEDVSR